MVPVYISLTTIFKNQAILLLLKLSNNIINNKTDCINNNCIQKVRMGN